MIAKIPLGKIERISVLLGGGRSLSQVRGDADYIINGGFFSWDTGKATGHLKVNGSVLAKETWNCWGLTWDDGPDIHMDVVPSGEKNYISGVELLTRDLQENGKLHYNSDVGGKRGRSAIGIANGDLILFCSKDGTREMRTPEALRDELLSIGCTHAIMLDGGGSCQCAFPEGEIHSNRRVHNYIGIWLKKEEDDPVGKKVVLDPGHGIETAGKCSPDGAYFEHEFNLDMARRVARHLERHGVAAVLTRGTENDVSLSDRVAKSNALRPDLFVSLHSNASGQGWTDPDGYGIYTSATGDTAERNKAAKAIIARVKAAGIHLWGNGLFHDIGLYVLKNTVSPAVLIEHGFHSNIHEVELLKTDVYRSLLAKVDAQGILDYLGITWVEEAAEAPVKPSMVCPHCGKPLLIVKGE